MPPLVEAVWQRYRAGAFSEGQRLAKIHAPEAQGALAMEAARGKPMTDPTLEAIKARLAEKFYVGGESRKAIQYLITRLEASEAKLADALDDIGRCACVFLDAHDPDSDGHPVETCKYHEDMKDRAETAEAEVERLRALELERSKSLDELQRLGQECDSE